MINKNTCVFITMIFILYSTVVANLLVSHGYFDDDRLYLYSTNFFVCEWEKWNQASADVIGFMKQSGYSDESIARFDFRYRYSDNYLIHSASICFVRAIILWDVLDLDYGTWVYVVLETGIGLGHLVCLLIVLAALWRTRRSDIPVIVLMTLLAMVAIFPFIQNPPWRLTMLHGPDASWIDFFVQPVWFVINPGPQLSIFGITPRSAATLLLVAVTVLRWTGHSAAGYWVIAFATLVHGTYGMLVLVIFVGLDVVLRPEALRSWHSVVPTIAVMTTAVFGIQSFQSFGGTWIGFGAFAIIISAFAGMVLPASERLLTKVPPIGWLRGLTPLYAETLLLFFGMVVTLVLAGSLANISSELTAKYIAHELSGRPVALMRIPFLLGIAAIVMRIRVFGLERLWPPAALVFAALFAVKTLYMAIPTTKTWLTAEEMELAIEISLSKPERFYPEYQIYYALSCQLDGRCNTLDRLLVSATSER